MSDMVKDVAVKEKKFKISKEVLCIIMFMMLVGSIICYAENHRNKEQEIIKNAVMLDDKKLLDVVSINNISYSEKFKVGDLAIFGDVVKNMNLQTNDKKCIFGNFNQDEKYQVYGYKYFFEDKVKFHVQDICKDLKMVK